jgi:hypothetical protein
VSGSDGLTPPFTLSLDYVASVDQLNNCLKFQKGICSIVSVIPVNVCLSLCTAKP